MLKKVYRFGSCRVFNLPQFALTPIRFANDPLGYTHSTKEVIQLIRLLRGEIRVDRHLFPYVFSCFEGKDRIADFQGRWAANAKALEQSDTVLLEISSCKIFQHDGGFLQMVLLTRPELHNLKPAPLSLVSSTEVSKQTPEDLQSDLQTISQHLGGKRLVLTAHINASVADGAVIPDRQLLEEGLRKFALSGGHDFYSAWELLGSRGGAYLCEDFTHFTVRGGLVVRRHLATRLLSGGLLVALLASIDNLLCYGLYILRLMKRRLLSANNPRARKSVAGH